MERGTWSNMIAREEIEAIRERAEKATSGPWWTSGGCEVTSQVDDSHVCDTTLSKGDYVSDAEFIAHAREDIPKLLAEIERLQTNWKRLKEYVDEYRDKAFEAHSVSEGGGARYFYAGRSSAFTNVQDLIRALEREGDEC
ncbi:ead/Ea22-like family protein [Brevibacillus laterosporus]|uniref:ead/Ea22-like family protein n=1 Tax=Brevibacillus laterosporus TaxID=1465 RepID=UPI0018CFCA52|nr:ead/Ea22-like family protein [Brevibacillus laterosporus]